MTDIEELKLRAAILKEAESFKRTPYHDHACLKMIGVDCASFAMLVYKTVGIIPESYVLPKYYPQQWLKREEDPTYLNEVLKFAYEIEEKDILPGDAVLYKMGRSYTHGAIVLAWPNRLIHSTKPHGVIISNANYEKHMKSTPHRCFSFVNWFKRQQS